MRMILRFLKPYKRDLVLAPACKLLEAIFELIVPLVMAKMIDVGIANRDAGYAWKMCGVMLLLGVCGLTFSLICQYRAAVCAFHFGADLRRGLYQHINRLSYAELDRLGTASLGTHLTSDTTAVQTGVNMFIRLAVRAPFLVIGAMIMAFLLDVRLSLIFLIVVPLIAAILYTVIRKTIPMFSQIQKKLERIFRLTGENLEGVRVIRAFSRQREEEDEYAAISDALAQDAIHAGNISALLNPLTFVILNLGIAAILWFGGVRIDGGSMSVGELTAFVNYMTQILLALIALAYLIVTFTKTAASATRLTKVFDTQPSLHEGECPLPKEPSAPAVSFENVEFTYPGAANPALSGITFSVAQGQTLGIIGGTGSGKSSVLHLISRFYDAQEGSVRVMGQDVREYRFSALRRAISLVPQKAVLYGGTILENMRRIRADATEDEVISALQTAQAWEFVSKLPEGIHTQLSQGGMNLSGGQRQRLGIARALVGHPPVVVLDDSMSALDYATDLALRRALSTDLAGTTVILVSQRVSSILHADHILVLEDGEQVGFGTHDTLRQTCPVYEEICRAQMQKEA